MKKEYEYKVIEFYGYYPEEYENCLNENGKEGWKFVNSFKTEGFTYITFEREKN